MSHNVNTIWDENFKELAEEQGCPKCNCHKTKGDIINHKEVLICRDCGYVWPEK